MSRSRLLSICWVFVFVVAVGALLVAAPATTWAQSTTSGAVTGTVADPSGAAISSAQVTLTQPATGATQTTACDAAGRYTFPNVAPGLYVLTTTAPSFRKTVVSNIDVEVTKTRIVNVKMQLGQVSQTVEVTASSMTDLQTSNASVGEVVSGQELNRLPVIGRDAQQLIFLQPAVAPSSDIAPGLSGMGTAGSGGDVSGGQIAGARTEQAIFTVDGGYASSDMEGSNSYISPNVSPGYTDSTLSAVVPTPQDSVQEFRVATNNLSANLTGSSGGQIAILTKSGTNSFHGSAYEYYDGDALQANSWGNNHYGVAKAHSADNRFGGDVGGPIKKDKLFFFGFYEGRRFHEASTGESVVPLPSLQQGIITFPNTSGGVSTYNLNPANGPLANNCGAGACDPRGIGVSPVVMSQLALLPTGTDMSFGDGYNTAGVIYNIPTPIITDVAKYKLDYNISSKWSGFATWSYGRTTRKTLDQVDLVGTPSAGSGTPYWSNFLTFQVQGVLSPNFTSVTHGSFLRNFWQWQRTPPTPQISGTDAALQIAGEGTGRAFASSSKLISDPVNINTQQGRSRFWDAHDWYIAQDFTFVHNSHTFQFGGAGFIFDDYHLRTDDVLGGLTTGPIYYVGAKPQSQDSYVKITGDYTPTDLNPDYASRWDGLYASLLGIVDHSAQVGVRDGNFQPSPLGTPLFDKVRSPAFETYFQDVWKATPNLTLTLGVDWGVQLSPTEQSGKEVVTTYAASGAPVNIQQYFQQRKQSLGAGCVPDGWTPSGGGPNPYPVCYNPDFSLTPVGSLTGPLHGKMIVAPWTDWGPRVAVAWQVPWENRLFGNHATVIRAGYSLMWDRTTTVATVLNSLLTGGLADVSACKGPITGSGGGVVACASTASNPTDAFRIGVDGSSVPIPAPTAKPIPYVPTSPFGLILTVPLDPYKTPAYSHVVDFTVQRALPHQMILELGYIGRFSRNLTQAQGFNAPYYAWKDPVSGQTLGQAFDALANQLRAGQTVTPQPFFENIVGAGGTALVAGDDPVDIANSDLQDFTLGELNFDIPNFVDNMQVLEPNPTTDGGSSDYNAMFLSIRKAFSNGLTFQGDWTWAHNISTLGTGQQYLYSSNSPFNIGLDRASDYSDHRHVVHFFGMYDLPFGKGGQFSTGNDLMDRVIGGWHISGIFTAFTGAPLCASTDFGNYGSFFTASCMYGNIPTLHVHGRSGSGTPNAFSDPAGVLAGLQFPVTGSRVPWDSVRAWPYWNVDFSVGKNLLVTERVKASLTVDAANVFNHPILSNPAIDVYSGASFGETNSQGNLPRSMQLGLRVDF